MLKILSVTVNYQENPSGITEAPQIGWVLDSDQNGTYQTLYRLTICDADRMTVFYDSGDVESSQSAHIVPAISLSGITTYTVFVSVQDNHGEQAEGTGSFITGYLSPERWVGDFISAENDAAEESFSTLLRKEFTVSSEVKDAYFIGSAHGLYNAYLNGYKVGDDWLAPGWTSYSDHLQYQIYPIADLLQPGDNAICIELGAGWYKGKMSFNLNRNHYGTETAFGGQILIRFQDGSVHSIPSDTSWKGCKGPVTFSEIYDGETCDMRLDPTGWKCNGYDDSSWSLVRKVDQDICRLVPQQGAGVQITDRIDPVSCIITPAGETVIDFGQVLTGWCNISVPSSDPGDLYKLQFFETLDCDGNVYTANLRSAKQTVTYISRGGEFSYHPLFTFQGFRYAHIIGWPGKPSLENFSAFVIHSRLHFTGNFSCSNKLVNKLHHNILWSMKGNFVDIPTDCPQRDERLGWTGDVQIFNSTAMYLANCYSFFSKWLLDVAADQLPDGGIPHVVPDIISGKSADDWLTKQGTYGASAWADVSVILPWNLYLFYGDTAVLARQYSSMKKWVDFMTAHSSEGCLFSYALQFGDWVALDAEAGSYFGATPTDYTCAAFYCYTTALFARIAGILGKEEDYQVYSRLASDLRASFREHFLQKDGHLTVRTQTAQIVALEFDLIPQKFREIVASDLVQLLRENDDHLVTGFIGTPYFCHALSSNGYLEEAYRLLLRESYPGWLYQITRGATTIWEHWDGLKPDGTMWSPDMNSFNHYSYGSVGYWLYSEAAGIQPNPDSPGFKHFYLRPRISNSLTCVQGSYESIYGKIKSSWELDENTVHYKFTVPPNTTATVILDQAISFIESDIPLNTDASPITGVVPSGSYHISFQLL